MKVSRLSKTEIYISPRALFIILILIVELFQSLFSTFLYRINCWKRERERERERERDQVSKFVPLRDYLHGSWKKK